MRLTTIVLIIIFNLVSLGLSERNATNEAILSRKRRYVAFPDGSSFSAALCTTIGVIGNPEVSYLSYALNWGVSYDLPNDTWVKESANGFQNNADKPATQRRYRRELFNKIEIAIDGMGFDGRECVSRALCESAKFFGSRTGNMVEELLKTIFSLPRKRVQRHEDPDIHYYDKVFRRARYASECEVEFPRCSFSLLELALGKYAVNWEKQGPDINPWFM